MHVLIVLRLLKNGRLKFLFVNCPTFVPGGNSFNKRGTAQTRSPRAVHVFTGLGLLISVLLLDII